jgi:hypothetical protein
MSFIISRYRVDLKRFPALTNIDYHLANLTSGGCLLIPTGWTFHENSLDTTVTIIHNLHHQRAIHLDTYDINTCTSTNTYDRSFTLDQINWSALDNEPLSLK